MQVKELGHIVLYVRDLERSVHFQPTATAALLIRVQE